jgi:aspartate/methionine/tyrosine aminotransferase
MTGWRIGYMAFPQRLMKKIDYLLTHSIGCVAEFTQLAAVEALQGPQHSILKMVDSLKKKRDFAVKELNDMGLLCSTPEGAFYLFPTILGHNKSSQEISDYLLNNGVAVLPGTAFGNKGEGFIRLSYATSEDKLKEGLKRIKRSIDKL